MDRTEEYRANAIRALEDLRLATDPESRVRLLKIAKAWLLLAREYAFDDSCELQSAPPTAPSSYDLRL